MKLTNVMLSVGLALASTAGALANELDPVAAALPRQLIVKIDEKSGEKTIFKSYSDLQVTSDKEAALLAKIAEEESEVIVPQALNELDQDSSQAAWYYYYQPNYWSYNYGYSYGYYGYHYSYSSYYWYANAGCNYYYYRY